MASSRLLRLLMNCHSTHGSVGGCIGNILRLALGPVLTCAFPTPCFCSCIPCRSIGVGLRWFVCRGVGVVCPFPVVFRSLRYRKTVCILLSEALQWLLLVLLPWLFFSALIQDSTSRLLASSLMIVCCFDTNARRVWNVQVRDVGIVVRTYVYRPRADSMFDFYMVFLIVNGRNCFKYSLHFSFVVVIVHASGSEAAHKISALLDLGALLPFECQSLIC